jgi:hypothetical protein
MTRVFNVAAVHAQSDRNRLGQWLRDDIDDAA